jgi:hypothetical protein
MPESVLPARAFLLVDAVKFSLSAKAIYTVVSTK